MVSTNSDIPVTYRDILFFLILIPFVNALNYYLTYSHIPFNTHTLITFLIDTADGYIAWWGFRIVILQMDRRMPYSGNPVKRIVVQIIVTSVVGLVIIIALTEFANWIATDKRVPSSFYQYDLFIFLIWFLVLNGIYIGLYYYQAMQYLEKLRQEDKKLKSDGFFVKLGNQNLTVPFSEILGFYVDGDYSILVTGQSKKYFLDQSLDKIEKLIPNEFFFRLNRQYILSRLALKGFSRAENGKLNILVGYPESFPDPVLVSRIKAPAFKKWYQPG